MTIFRRFLIVAAGLALPTWVAAAGIAKPSCADPPCKPTTTTLPPAGPVAVTMELVEGSGEGLTTAC